jgi:hypothetical protein
MEEINKEAISIIDVPKYLISIYSKKAEEYMLPANLFDSYKQIYDIDTTSLESVNDLKINENNQEIVYTTALTFLALSSDNNTMLKIVNRLLTILLDFNMKINDPEIIEPHFHPKKLSKFILISYILSQSQSISVKRYVDRFFSGHSYEYEGIDNDGLKSVIKIMIEAGWDELLKYYAKYFTKQEYYETMLQSCLKFSDHKNNFMKYIILYSYRFIL